MVLQDWILMNKTINFNNRKFISVGVWRVDGGLVPKISKSQQKLTQSQNVTSEKTESLITLLYESKLSHCNNVICLKSL
jgi:hypothetical protein